MEIPKIPKWVFSVPRFRTFLAAGLVAKQVVRHIIAKVQEVDPRCVVALGLRWDVMVRKPK